MASHPPPVLLLLFHFLLSPLSARTQSISTDMPLPPMEWIKLSPAGSTTPPPLAYGCLNGPTPSSNPSEPRQAYLYGGRSLTSTSSSSIYVLDYSSDPPSWSQPAPSVSTIFTSAPSPRSHLVCGWDSSSNFRNQLNIFGGRSQDRPLNDFWSYDPINRFWVQPATPLQHAGLPGALAVYGAIGGMDPTYTPSAPATSNALIFIGGSNSTHSNLDLNPYGLSLDGQLAANTNTLTANLTSLGQPSTNSDSASSQNLIRGRWGMSGALLPGSKLVTFSGCNTDPSSQFSSSTPDPTCSLPNGGILKFQSSFTPSGLAGANPEDPKPTWQPIQYCPAPRIGGTMVPNRNRHDSSYTNQVIMIGGRVDHQNWDDQGGSESGEVSVLDITSGLWARVIPASRNNVTFTAKEGVFALALPVSITGGSTSTSADTDILVYGGIDVKTGQASSELWILRLHGSDKLTGNGTAAGVTMSYMPNCVTPTPTNSIVSPTTAADASNVTQDQLRAPSGHVIFAIFSLLLIMISLTVLRFEEPGNLSIKRRWRTPQLWIMLAAWQTLIMGYAFFVLSFFIGLGRTYVNRTGTGLTKRALLDVEDDRIKLSPATALEHSTHAKIGLVLAVIGCLGVPALYALSWLIDWQQEIYKRKVQPSDNGTTKRLKVKPSHDRSAIGRWVHTIRRPVSSLARPRAAHKESESKPDSGLRAPRSIAELGRNGLTHHLGSRLVGDKRQEDEKRSNGSSEILGSVEAHSRMDEEELGEGLAGQTSVLDHLSHGRLGSTSTSYTQTGLLAGLGLTEAGQLDGNEPTVTAPTAVGGTGNDNEQQRSIRGSTGDQRVRSQKRNSAQDSPRGKQGKRTEEGMLDMFQAKIGWIKKGFNVRNSKRQEDEKTGEATAEGTPNSGFVVMNRKPNRRPTGGLAGGANRRISLDIMSDAGSVERNHYQSREEYEEAHRIDENLEEEEEEEDDDDDDDDDDGKKKLKARSKIRRLADVILHSVLLITNGYVFVSCLMMDVKQRQLGGVFGTVCLLCYIVMVVVAWKSKKPSEESTLVIFFNIIRGGRSGVNHHGNLEGLNEDLNMRGLQTPTAFSTFGQAIPPTLGTLGTSMMSHDEHAQGMYSNRFRSPSFSGTSNYNQFSNLGHFIGANNSGEDEGEYVRRVWDEQLDEVSGPIGQDRYLSEREIQIVTTAPRRKLTVVNG